VTIGGCNEGHRRRYTWRGRRQSSGRAAPDDAEKDGSQGRLRSDATWSTCAPDTLRH
jgi:hypothetical protein